MCLTRMNEVSGSCVIILAGLLVAHAMSGLVLRALQFRQGSDSCWQVDRAGLRVARSQDVLDSVRLDNVLQMRSVEVSSLLVWRR